MTSSTRWRSDFPINAEYWHGRRLQLRVLFIVVAFIVGYLR